MNAIRKSRQINWHIILFNDQIFIVQKRKRKFQQIIQD